MPYVGTVNMAGYLPEGEPAVFDSPREAWRYLADIRERDEDDTPGDDYTWTCITLRELADGRRADGMDPDAPGIVHGASIDPGPHDLGWMFSVSEVSDADAREIAGDD